MATNVNMHPGIFPLSTKSLLAEHKQCHLIKCGIKRGDF